MGSGILLSGIDFLKPGTLDYPLGALCAESDNGIELALSDNKERKPANNRMVRTKQSGTQEIRKKTNLQRTTNNGHHAAGVAHLELRKSGKEKIMYLGRVEDALRVSLELL